MQQNTISWIKDIVLLTVLISFIFFLFLGNRPLFVPDEARYSEIPREMVVTKNYVTPHINYIKYFEKPPFFYWLQTLSVHMFGLGEFSMRFMTALMALLGVIFTYLTGRRIYNRLTGWLASLILASSLLYYVMARFITIDMTLSVLLSATLFSFIFVLRAPPEQKNKWILLLYFFSALATLSKGLIGIILPGAIIFIWILIYNDWRNIKTYLSLPGIILWLIIVLPWHILVQLRNPEFFHFYFIEQQFARYFTHYAHRSQAFWFLPATLILGFLPWIIFFPQTFLHSLPKWKNRFQYKEQVFLLLWIAIIYGFFQLSESQLPPYLLPIFPPLAILTAHYLSQHWQQHRDKFITYSLIVFAIGFVILSLALLIAIMYFHVFPDIKNYLFIMIFVAIFIVAIILLSYFKYGIKIGIVALIVGSFILFTALNSVTKSFAEDKSIKDLALDLKPLLSDKDAVVSYHGYYQDLPFYLQRRIVVVGWGNSELTFGMEHQNMQDWFWDDKTLWKNWAKTPRIVLFMSQNDYNDLLKKGIEPLILLAKNPNNVVVTNKSLIN